MIRLLEQAVVPTNQRGDAGHVAVSAVHDVDYLLTWNYAHMTNPSSQARWVAICDQAGLVNPLMVSPESIPQVRFGQTIRRRRQS